MLLEGCDWWEDPLLFQSGKDYVVGQIMECLDDISSIVQNKYVDTDNIDEIEEPGQFVTTIDKVRSGLSINANNYWLVRSCLETFAPSYLCDTLPSLNGEVTEDGQKQIMAP